MLPNNGIGESGGDYECTIDAGEKAKYVMFQEEEKMRFLNLAVYAGYDCYRRKFRIEDANGADVNGQTFSSSTSITEQFKLEAKGSSLGANRDSIAAACMDELTFEVGPVGGGSTLNR